MMATDFGRRKGVREAMGAVDMGGLSDCRCCADVSYTGRVGLQPVVDQRRATNSSIVRPAWSMISKLSRVHARLLALLRREVAERSCRHVNGTEAHAFDSRQRLAVGDPVLDDKLDRLARHCE